MTDDRRAELVAKKQHIDMVAIVEVDAIVRSILKFKTQFDPSVYSEIIYRVREQLGHLEVEAENNAELYEKAEYGVSLIDIDDEWDEPIGIRDERLSPLPPIS